MPITLINEDPNFPDPYIPVPNINIFVWFITFLLRVQLKVVKSDLLRF